MSNRVEKIRHQNEHISRYSFMCKDFGLSWFDDTIFRLNKRLCTNVKRLSRIESNKSFSNKKLNRLKVALGTVRFDMLCCPSGMFFRSLDNPMLAPRGRNVRTYARHILDKPFYLAETEVTNELYYSVITELSACLQYSGPYKFFEHQRPATDFTWYDAMIFCNRLSELEGLPAYYKLENEQTGIANNDRVVQADVYINKDSKGYRLPTDIEWEYAALAGTNNSWAGTDSKEALHSFAVFQKGGEQFEAPEPVKTKHPNEWGFYDMSGNVREWCVDSKSQNALTKGNGYEDRLGSHIGGIWYSNNENEPGAGNSNIGLRLAKDI